MNKNFSTDTALRDFNQMLLPVLLPTDFHASKGEVVHSDSRNRMEERVRALGGRKVMFTDHRLPSLIGGKGFIGSKEAVTEQKTTASSQNEEQDDTLYDALDDGSF